MKHEPKDLAWRGGPVAFPEPLHVGRPNVGDRARFLERAGAILDRRWLTNDGELVHAFERQLAGWTGRSHCVAVTNGTMALALAVRAMGLTGEVILPSFTFVATAHVLEWHGLVPVFCDVDPRTHTIDPRRVPELVTPRTSAILGVHLWGRPCDVEGLQEVADRYGLRVVFDAAHAFACDRDGMPVARDGEAAALSFHATKILNSFEGGAICTDRGDLADRLRLMRNSGFAGRDTVVAVGLNAKMTEIAAAMGLTNLEALPRFLAANRENFDAYRRGLADCPGVSLVDTGTSRAHVVVEVDEAAFGASRDHLVDVLWAENVRARRYFYPGCHRQEPYVTRYPDAVHRLGETERLCARVLVLPTGTALTPDDVAVVCSIIRVAAAAAAQG
ncbi:MAG TPA: aminotransferase class I/II-fold pyridoxal phosphate-dependent enzyme [Vicinamibacterales bacterium]|nr:aminotransferase class I/II-fold pyridoxal phosphate-dependent enzyme [Vicinamibacterales bacterium]